MTAAPLTLTEVNQHLTAARAIMQKAADQKSYRLFTANNESQYDYYRQSELVTLESNWKQLERLLKETNFDNLTPAESTTLRSLLTGQVQKKALKIAYRLVAKDLNEARQVTTYELPTKKIKAIHGRQAKRSAKSMLTDFRETKTNPQVVVPTLPKVVFPNLATINPAVDKAMKALHKAWTAASSLPSITAEDQFLLTETATTYLPDAWRMYHNLAGMPEEIQTQAADMLLTQTTALTTRIKTISADIGTSALKELRAHTTFIIGKNTTDQELHLK